MFKIYLILSVLFLAEPILSQSVYKGAIKSMETRLFIPFATVRLGQQVFVCDSIGQFTIPSLSFGRYKITIGSSGYETISAMIDIPGAGVLYLPPDRGQLEQVTVTAVAGATRIRRTPIAISVVTQKDMERNSSTNMIDALLKAVPGISAVTTGPNISKPFIRGLGYNRVLTMYDGIRQEGQQWGDEHGIEVDQYGIVRAEIVKGPASMSYGSDAIAGVVNLIPFQPIANDDKLHGDIATEYQTNNRLIGKSVSAYHRKNNLWWQIRSSAKQAADYHNAGDGYVYNTGFKEWTFSSALGWESKRRKDQLSFTLYNNLQEIPDGSRDSLTRAFTYQTEEGSKDDIRNRPLINNNQLRSYNISALHQHIQHVRLYHKGRYTLANGELLTSIGFQQNARREYNHPLFPSQAGLYVTLNTINYELKYSFPEWSGMRFTYGINGMYQQNRSRDATDFPIPDYQLLDIGNYIMAKKEYKKWVISGGIRIDKRSVKWKDLFTKKDPATGFTKQVYFPDTIGTYHNFNAFSQTFTGVSASVGAVYNANVNLTIKANIARGYRSPNITEMGSAGLDPGAHIYYIGSKSFVPEVNWQEDLGVFFHTADIDVSAELFNNTIDHYIFLQKQFDSNGQPLEIVPGNFTYAYKQGKGQLYGIEAILSLHPKTVSWLQFTNSMSVITGLNKDQLLLNQFGSPAKYLPLIPPLKATSRLLFNIPTENKRLADAYFFAETEIHATQNRFYGVDETETVTKGYALVNAGAGISIGKKENPFCRLSVNVNNLFDVLYQSHLNRLKYFEYYSGDTASGIYNMGKSVGVKMLFSW